MLWLLKWALIALFVGFIWFSYNFITALNTEERLALKSELTEALDGPANGPMVQKAREDFMAFGKEKIKILIHKILD